ncbi:MAG: serine/threonine-protein kinase, partial [Acidobacteriota bacterium]
MIGRTLNHYRIEEKIGAGGMGEVYRATDSKLGREVAIKVLPDAFAKDPERLARFDQEARLLASLNHPNIAAIHGLEESDGVRFLVLELVPGDTLAERISQGPIPVDEALTLCRQIAEALEAAHERGIIHRDLKPANVKVTPDGKVKVLDFGLAKAFQTDSSAAVDLSQSPTASYRATSAGVIL